MSRSQTIGSAAALYAKPLTVILLAALLTNACLVLDSSAGTFPPIAVRGFHLRMTAAAWRAEIKKYSWSQGFSGNPQNAQGPHLLHVGTDNAAPFTIAGIIVPSPPTMNYNQSDVSNGLFFELPIEAAQPLAEKMLSTYASAAHDCGLTQDHFHQCIVDTQEGTMALVPSFDMHGKFSSYMLKLTSRSAGID